MSTELIFALVCAVAAIVYGVVSIGWIMAKPTGNDRMREIAAAIQAGAQAYLNRQYMTIGIVGVAAVRRHLGGAGRRDRGRIRRRRHPVGPRRLHRDERLGALERAHGRGGAHGAQRSARGRVPRRRDHRHARRRPRPPRRRRLLLVPAGLGARRAEPDEGRPAPRDPAARRPRLRRLADLDLRASWRRHLHQGRRRRRRSRRQGRGRHSGRRPAQPGGDRRQRRRQRRRLRRHGRRPVRDLRGDDRRDDAAGRAADAGEGRGRGHVSAGAGRLLDPGVDRRLLFRQGARRRQDHERALSRPDGRRRDLRHRLLVHHQPDDGRRRGGVSGNHDAAPLRRRRWSASR